MKRKPDNIEDIVNNVLLNHLTNFCNQLKQIVNHEVSNSQLPTLPNVTQSIELPPPHIRVPSLDSQQEKQPEEKKKKVSKEKPILKTNVSKVEQEDDSSISSLSDDELLSDEKIVTVKKKIKDKNKETGENGEENEKEESQVGGNEEKEKNKSHILTQNNLYYSKAVDFIWNLTNEERTYMIEKEMDIILKNHTKTDNDSVKYLDFPASQNPQNTESLQYYYFRVCYARSWLIRHLTPYKISTKTKKVEKNLETPHHCTKLKMCKFCNGIAVVLDSGFLCTTLYCPGPNDLPYNSYLSLSTTATTTDDNNGKNGKQTLTQAENTKEVKSALMTKYVFLEDKQNRCLIQFSNLITTVDSTNTTTTSSNHQQTNKLPINLKPTLDLNQFKKVNIKNPLFKVRCSTALRKSNVSKGCQAVQNLFLDWFVFLRMEVEHQPVSLSDTSSKKSQCPIGQHYLKTLCPSWFKKNISSEIIEKVIGKISSSSSSTPSSIKT